MKSFFQAPQGSPFQSLSFPERLSLLGSAFRGDTQPMQQAAQLGRERAQRQELGRILSGQQTPAFLRPGGAEYDPQQYQQGIMRQLASVGSPETMEILSKLALASPKNAYQQKFAQALTDPNRERRLESLGLLAAEGYEPAQKELAMRTRPRKPLIQMGSDYHSEKLFEQEEKRAEVIARNPTYQMRAKQVAKGVARGATGKFSLLSKDITGFKEKFAPILGLKIDEDELKKAKSTAEIQKYFGEKVLEKLDALGSNPSNADRDFAAKISGDVTEDKASILSIFALDGATIRKEMYLNDLQISLEDKGFSEKEIIRKIREVNKDPEILENFYNEELAKLENIKAEEEERLRLESGQQAGVGQLATPQQAGAEQLATPQPIFSQYTVEEALAERKRREEAKRKSRGL